MTLYYGSINKKCYVYSEKGVNMKLKDSVYDVLKWICLVCLPALGALYFALAGIWNFPDGQEIVGTITCIDTFLGALLGISTIQYNKGLAEKKEE